MPEHLSYSSIGLYNSCARAWRFKYVEKIVTSINANMAFGSAFHDSIEAYIINRESGAECIPLAELWISNLQHQLERQQIAFADESAEQLAETGLRMLTAQLEITTNGKPSKMTMDALLATLKPALSPTSDALRIEERLELQVPGVFPPIIGYVDMIAQDGIPCDFKTAARAWSPDKPDNEMQPTFYLAALNQAGHIVDTFRYYIFTKAKQPRVQVLETKRTPADLFWLFGMIADVYAAIEARVFPPTGAGSWRCTPEWCEYWNNCKGK